MKQVYSLTCVMILALLSLTSVKVSAQLAISITSHTNPTCNAACNGSINTSTTGGTPPYTYSWTNTPQTTANVTSLCAGVYTVTVTDAAFATAAANITLTQPMALSITITSQTNSLCYAACTGSATAIVSGGNGPYTYSWVPSGGTSPTLSGACPGTYTITVMDANGCYATRTVTITQPPQLIANAGSDITICSGASTTLSGISSGGTGSYTFQWSGPNSYYSNIMSPTVSPTVTSTYTLTITDSNGCTATDMVTVFVNPGVTLTMSSLPATCNQSNGQASVVASGGTTPYNYLWNNNAITSSITNLSAGVYSVNVTDALGCAANNGVAVNNASGPSVTVSNQVNSQCYGNNNGTATVAVTGNGPFTYSWNTSPVQTTATSSNLPPGNFFCTVTDVNNCISSASVLITQPPQFYLGAQIMSLANCASGGTARTWASGGTPPYTFAWSNAATGDTIYNLPAGSFTITATDNAGCISTGTGTMSSGSYAYVSGRCYFDNNSNCIYDAGDAPIINQFVADALTGYTTNTDSTGSYHIYVNTTGSQIIYTSPSFYSPYTTAYCPSNNQTNVLINALCDTVANVDFSRSLISGVRDLRVQIGMSQNPRAGFPNNILITYSNIGTMIINNTTVSLVYDSILTYHSCSLTPSINNQAYLEWNTGTLIPGQVGWINLVLDVPTIQNGGWIGRPLFYATTINPIPGDTNSADNGDDEFRHIVASWDPNEKICESATMDSLGHILPSDSLLEYTIHFQNTGTDTAFNIYVIDTLSTYLDPTTVIPGVSDHHYSFEMSGNGEMRFNFFNIMLPDSNHNEPASNAFVKYSVKRRPNLPLGTVIDNTAYIYFDFNPAVVTNTTSNMIWLTVPLSVNSEQSENFALYPNPANETVTLALPQELNGKNCEVVITDATGRIVSDRTIIALGKTDLDLASLSSGVYFCTVKCEGATLGIQKLVRQ